MAGLSLIQESSTGRGESPDVSPEVGKVKGLGPLASAGNPLVPEPPPTMSSPEAAQIALYLQRQTEATMLRFVQFMEEVEARDQLRTDAILNLDAQTGEALKKVSALLDRAGLSIQTIESNAGSSIKKLDQASATVGTLGRALGNYGDELSRAMQEQIRVSARDASEQMLATLEPRFNKVFTRLWISLALFVVVMAATFAWFWPSPAQPQGPQSATAPRSRPPQP
jgi:Fe2+ transport system protein B